jgi:hypothetical protein
VSRIRSNPETGVLFRKAMHDGRSLDLTPTLFGFRLKVGASGSLSYDDTW